MASTDVVLIIFILFLLVNGTSQGFLRSLISPASLIFALILSTLYYLTRHDFRISLLIAVIGPFVFGRLFLAIIKKMSTAEEPPPLSLLSRLGGQIVNLVWGGSFALVFVAFLAVFPLERFELDGISNDVRRSVAFQLIKPFLDRYNIRPIQSSSCGSPACTMKAKDMRDLASDEEVQALMQDPRIQKMMGDPAIQDAVQKKDMAKLLTNPTILELSQDPQFLVKALKVYGKIKERAGTP